MVSCTWDRGSPCQDEGRRRQGLDSVLPELVAPVRRTASAPFLARSASVDSDQHLIKACLTIFQTCLLFIHVASKLIVHWLFGRSSVEWGVRHAVGCRPAPCSRRRLRANDSCVALQADPSHGLAAGANYALALQLALGQLN